jgi:diguanylate cyclase (GGDEF)-like protein
MEEPAKTAPDLLSLSREELVEQNLEMKEEIAILQLAIEALKNELDYREKISFIDLQTGLYNSNFFTKKLIPRLEKHVEDERRQSGKTRVFGMVDVDDTNKFNEWYGHPGCDTIVEIIAQIINGEIRSDEDIVGRRYSNGDEFYILLNFEKTDVFDVGEVVESFKDRINKQLRMAFDDQVKISMGFVQVGLCKSAEEVIKEADNLMYQEKKAHKSLNQQSFVV